MIKAAVFDLDGTLYDETGAYPAAIAAAASKAHELCGIGEKDFEAAAAREFNWQKARYSKTAAYHSRHVRFQRVLEGFCKQPSLAFALANCYWEAYLNAVKVRPDARSTLEALRAAGLRVGIGTNMTCAMQLAKIERLGLGDLIDFIVTSEEAGYEKPLPEFFAFVCEKAQCAPDEILFCGDNCELDAHGACAAGLNGVWLALDAPPRPGIKSVHALSELLALI